jgi:hypothetical protein
VNKCRPNKVMRVAQRVRDDALLAFSLARRNGVVAAPHVLADLSDVKTALVSPEFVEVSSLLIAHHLDIDVGARLAVAMKALNPSIGDYVRCSHQEYTLPLWQIGFAGRRRCRAARRSVLPADTASPYWSCDSGDRDPCTGFASGSWGAAAVPGAASRLSFAALTPCQTSLIGGMPWL